MNTATCTRFTIRALVLPALFATALCAQKSTTTTTTTTNTSNPPVNRTPTSNTTTPSTNSNPGSQRPVFIAGKVQISDGSPVPTGITIERVCGAATRAVAYTDTKGRFQFEWGRSNGVLPDASNPSTRGFGGMEDSMSATSATTTGILSSGGGSNNVFGSTAETEMMGCELRANAPGFRSDTVNLAGRRSLDNPDVGIILLHRMGNVEGTSISATSYNAPKDAKKAYDKGIESMHKGKNDDAAKSFEKAVDVYPKYADAWYQLGRMRTAADDRERARDAYRRALDADAKLVGPSVELGLLALNEKKWKDAAEYLDRAVKLDPVDYPQAWFGSAVAHYTMHEYDPAEKAAREAIKLDPKKRNPRMGYLLGLVLAEKQDFAGATTLLREYLKNTPEATDGDTVRKQLLQLEKLSSNGPVAPVNEQPK